MLGLQFKYFVSMTWDASPIGEHSPWRESEFGERHFIAKARAPFETEDWFKEGRKRHDA